MTQISEFDAEELGYEALAAAIKAFRGNWRDSEFRLRSVEGGLRFELSATICISQKWRQTSGEARLQSAAEPPDVPPRAPVKRPYNMSPESRERLSQRMRAMWRDGKFEKSRPGAGLTHPPEAS